MYQRILVPIDGSPTSDQGLDEAIALARVTGGSIRLLHVLDDLVFTTGFETGATYARNVLPALRQGSERIVAAGRKRVSAGSVESNPRVFFVKDVVAMIGRMFGLDGLGWGEGIIALPSVLGSCSQCADQQFPYASIFRVRGLLSRRKLHPHRRPGGLGNKHWWWRRS